MQKILNINFKEKGMGIITHHFNMKYFKSISFYNNHYLPPDIEIIFENKIITGVYDKYFCEDSLEEFFKPESCVMFYSMNIYEDLCDMYEIEEKCITMATMKQKNIYSHNLV